MFILFNIIIYNKVYEIIDTMGVDEDGKNPEGIIKALPCLVTADAIY